MWLSNGDSSFEIYCPTSLSWDKESNLATSTSASGYTRAAYFGGARVLRSMSISYDLLSPEDAGTIEALSHLGFGEELSFYPTGAERANLLTPGASLLATMKDVERRPFTMAEGVLYPSGVYVADAKLIADETPFPFGGKKVVLSAVGRNSAAFSMQWRDSYGAVISYSGVTAPAGSTYQRLQNTVIAPPDAVTYRAHVKGDIAAPAVTVDRLYPWQVGQAAKSVVIESGAGEMVAAWDKQRGNYTKASFTIREVGEYV